jgi:hypothetical protein
LLSFSNSTNAASPASPAGSPSAEVEAPIALPWNGYLLWIDPVRVNLNVRYRQQSRRLSSKSPTKTGLPWLAIAASPPDRPFPTGAKFGFLVGRDADELAFLREGKRDVTE